MPKFLRMIAPASAALVLSLASPALALCDLCNASVRFDDDLAACFSERADAEIARLQTEGVSFIMVDLSDCESRGSLPTGASIEIPPETLDARFIADEASLACLSKAIVDTIDSIGAGHVFDLAALCG